MGVSLGGIDFRPATGDLYALGSDKVGYRVNVKTPGEREDGHRRR
jgi:hypothetical protein